MTVSQMTATSTAESHQQRLHWLAEQVLNWSDLPVVHIRPTSFLDNPLFTTLAARSIQASATIALPFGTGRTSPVAVDDVARVVATVLREPASHTGNVYELTGPRTLDMIEMAEEFTRALGRPVTYTDVPLDRWRAEVLAKVRLPQHIEDHNRRHGKPAPTESLRPRVGPRGARDGCTRPDGRGVRGRPQGLLSGVRPPLRPDATPMFCGTTSW